MENKKTWVTVRKELARLALETVVRITTILCAAAWFASIAGVAVGLGWMVHALEGTHLISEWMCTGLSWIEGALFVADAVGLVWAIVKNLIKELRD